MKKCLIVCGLCAAVSVFAQGPPPRGAGRMGPGGPGMGFGMGMGMGRTVTGAPYSAQEVTEETQTLANGNVITRKTEANIYRDSSGRVRTERTVPAGRPGQGQSGVQAQTATRTMISIHDPVAGVNTELDSAAKTARQMTLPNFRGHNPNFQGRPGRGQNGAASDPNVVTTDLGMQTINGIQATGTRVTRTIPAGQIGNAQPLQIVTETWRSPDLQVPVMTKRVDPLHGNVTVQLTNITRAEPDPSLFQVPTDYTISAGRGPRGASRTVKQ
ncbi:MAG TPA: hypothetical protein VMB03_09955 [Bryobacteraceae bacterium]|nr:hypothetical protein [Bryobacteraceae bacterium]